jgi:hypothetical protein
MDVSGFTLPAFRRHVTVVNVGVKLVLPNYGLFDYLAATDIYLGGTGDRRKYERG